MKAYTVELFNPDNHTMKTPDDVFAAQYADDDTAFSDVITRMKADGTVRTAYYGDGFFARVPQWVLHTDTWQHVAIVTPRPHVRAWRAIYFHKGEVGFNWRDTSTIRMGYKWRDVTPSSKARVRRVMAHMHKLPDMPMWEHFDLDALEGGAS